ncbi:MAG: hypothetical protein KUL82_08250 [Bdellovibrio sp.]|nr:hypothetical protein [Bdellovibrio sp.]
MPNGFKLNNLEQEVIVLTAVYELINGTVNHEVLEIGAGDEIQIGFKSRTHFNFFCIMLVDFLSKPDGDVFGIRESYLSSLRSIISNPLLGSHEAARNLKNSTDDFSSWLQTHMKYDKAWFPSVELQLDLSIKRSDMIVFCGNISKHNFTRLTKVAQRLQNVFKDQGHDLNLHQSLSIISEFQEQFQNNILSYHSTTIAASLNKIRWGIFEYLQPTYQAVYTPLSENPPGYSYKFPDGINHKFAQECFWDLMNKIRSKPWIQNFSPPSYLKSHY